MSRQIRQLFDKYQKARSEFVQTVAEQASKSDNIQILMDAGVLSLLRPLLLDNVSSIKQTAALALGRLANCKEEIAKQIVHVGILPEIVEGLDSSEVVKGLETSETDRIADSLYYKTNACFVVRTIAKHSPALAQQCVDAGALEPLVGCLKLPSESGNEHSTKSADSSLKMGHQTHKLREAASLAIGCIATHSKELAQSVVESGAIPYLISAVQDPEMTLKRIAVTSLGDIAKHTQELTQSIIDAQGIKNIAPLLALRNADAKLKQQVCITLAQIAKHSTESAELVVEGEIFPQALNCLRDKDSGLRKAAAVLIREVVSHTQELAQLVMNAGGAAHLVQYISPEANNDPMPGATAIGYIAAYSQALANTLINAKAPTQVLTVFVSSKSESVKATCAWALGQLGKHSPESSSKLTRLNALSLLLAAHNDPNGGEELQNKTKEALKLVISNCTEIEALQPLITKAPERILKSVLARIAKLLPKNPKQRAPFVKSGGFEAVQKIKAQPGSKIQEYIDAINNCYPEQAVRYYSPQTAGNLQKEIENS